MSSTSEDLICVAIENAEEVRDPLDDLVGRTEADPGAAFAPEVLEALVALRQQDRAHFEGLRARLKRAGCRVTALDESLAKEAGDDSGRGPKQADLLIELAQEVELFHGPDSTAYADLQVNEHRETWPVRTKGFRRWLARRFFEATGGAPNSEALQSALNVIEAKAHFDGPERDVHIRIGGLGDKLYLDLGDEGWRAVEIDSDGWRVVDEPPVRFRRAAGMQPLPTPARGGSVETLRNFLNVQGDGDFTLVVAWALAVLRDRGPYPVLVLAGEQGSAKSTFSAVLRSLLDPNTAPLRALPREDRDLFIAASNGHVLAFDNVSGLPAWISDTLCRLATGGGFAVRQLYTDQDEVLFDASRPVILNGIEDTFALFSLSGFRRRVARGRGGRPPAIARLEFLRSRVEALEVAANAIARNPRRMLAGEEVTVPYHRAVRATGPEILRSFRSGRVLSERGVSARLPTVLNGFLPERIRLRRRRSSLDLPEHREMAACLRSWSIWLTTAGELLDCTSAFEDAERKRTGDAWAARCRRLARRLGQLGKLPPFAEAGEAPPRLMLSSLFRNDPEYRRSFRFGAVTLRPGMTPTALQEVLRIIVDDALP